MCKNLMNIFKLNCPLQCGKKFGLIDIEKHKERCERLKDAYRCSLCNIKLEYHPNLQISHRNQCEKFKIPCTYCLKKQSIDNYKTHIKVCKEIINYCQNCNLMVSKKSEDAHMKVFCPHIQKLSHLINKVGNI